VCATRRAKRRRARAVAARSGSSSGAGGRPRDARRPSGDLSPRYRAATPVLPLQSPSCPTRPGRPGARRVIGPVGARRERSRICEQTFVRTLGVKIVVRSGRGEGDGIYDCPASGRTADARQRRGCGCTGPRLRIRHASQACFMDTDSLSRMGALLLATSTRRLVDGRVECEVCARAVDQIRGERAPVSSSFRARARGGVAVDGAAFRTSASAGPKSVADYYLRAGTRAARWRRHMAGTTAPQARRRRVEIVRLGRACAPRRCFLGAGVRAIA
jgi:hypothetical protein